MNKSTAEVLVKYLLIDQRPTQVIDENALAELVIVESSAGALLAD
jgi:hypothetical protein